MNQLGESLPNFILAVVNLDPIVLEKRWTDGESWPYDFVEKVNRGEDLRWVGSRWPLTHALMYGSFLPLPHFPFTRTYLTIMHQTATPHTHSQITSDIICSIPSIFRDVEHWEHHSTIIGLTKQRRIRSLNLFRVFCFCPIFLLAYQILQCFHFGLYHDTCKWI